MNSSVFNVELITGKTNSTIAEITKLADKKYRNKSKCFMCDGIKLFSEAVDCGADIRYVIVNDEAVFKSDIIEKITMCRNNGARLLCVTSQVFSKLTSEMSPQGIITVCGFFEKKHRFFANAKNIYCDEKIVILESVRDPGNIGTIIRNAAAFGVDRLVLSSDCADIYSPKVIRSAMGAVFKIGIDVVDNISTVIEALKATGRRVFASALGKKSLILGKDKFSTDDVIILGNEGHGISNDTIDMCDDTVFIPMKENTESLNVATASAVFMWEIFGR